MGKGSKQRPLSVSKEKFDENFDRIFGNKKETVTVSVSGTTGQGHTLTVKDLSVTVSPK